MMLLGLFVLCLAWLLPGHYFPWVSFEQEFAAAVGAVLLGFAAVANARVSRWPTLAWGVLACALIPLAQLLAGQVRFISDGVLAAFYLAGFGLCIVIGATLVRARGADWLEGLAAVLLVAAFVSTGLALLQWLRLPWLAVFVTDLPPGGRPYANLAQPNHLAALLALGVAGLLRWYETRRIGGAAAALGVAWFGLGMAMTQSRAAWLFAALVVLAWLALRRRARLRLSGRALTAGVLAFAALVLVWGPLNEALYLSSPPALSDRLEPGSRRAVWLALADAAWRARWFGYGWTQVGLAQQATALDHAPIYEYFRNSHNLLLDLVLWNGLPLGVLVAGGLAAWFMRQVRACRDPGRWAFLLAVSAIFVHSLVEFPLESGYFLVPVGLLMGTLDALGEGTSAQPLPRMALALPALILSALLAWVGIEYVQVQEAARTLRLVNARIGLDRVSEAPVPEVRLLDAPREFHRYVLTEARIGMKAEELEWMRAVAQRNAFPPALLRLALAAGLNGHPQEASTILARLCYMHQPARCAEGRKSWAKLQEQYPELRVVHMPAELPAVTEQGR